MNSADKIGIYVTIAVVIVMVIFAMLAQGTPNVVNEQNNAINQQNNAINPTSIVFGINGSGKTVTASSIPHTAVDCTPGNAVDVAVSIGGGAVGNTIVGNAYCGGILVSTATGVDPGTKTVTGTQTTNVATCSWQYTGNLPNSNWWVDCVFN